MRTMTCALTALTALCAALVLPSQAQERWPQRPVTIIVPFAAGGTADLFGRMLGAHMQAKYGQSFIVENRVGAAGNLGTAAVARAAPDGHTLLLGTTGGFAINPFLYAKLPHDTVRDFQPVSLIARVPNLLVVHPKVPAKTIPELVAYLKANPDRLSYGSSGIGSSQHLGTELFKIKTGTQMIHVPYRSSNEIMNALNGGHIEVALDNITLVLPQVKAGNARPLGMSTLARSPSAPDIPTIAETLPGFEGSAWHGIFVPAATPRAIVDKLGGEMKAMLELADTKAKFFELGAVPAPMSPEAFAAFVNEERGKWQEVVRTAGVKVE
jgi:tripartite-type tricarboxylate transporter receptor subunit TctC